MSIESIFANHQSDDAALSKQLELLRLQQVQLKKDVEQQCVDFYKENPESQIEIEKLLGISLPAVVRSIGAVVECRSLYETECSPQLFDIVIADRKQYEGASVLEYNLVDAVFKNLSSTELRNRFMFYADKRSNQVLRLSESASTILLSEFGVHQEIDGNGDKSCVYLSGSSIRKNLSTFSIALKKGAESDAEQVAQSLFNLYSANPEIDEFFIDSIEDAMASIDLEIHSDNSVSVEYLRKNSIEFSGGNLKENLVDACKFLANTHWFFD